MLWYSPDCCWANDSFSSHDIVPWQCIEGPQSPLWCSTIRSHGVSSCYDKCLMYCVAGVFSTVCWLHVVPHLLCLWLLCLLSSRNWFLGFQHVSRCSDLTIQWCTPTHRVHYWFVIWRFLCEWNLKFWQSPFSLLWCTCDVCNEAHVFLCLLYLCRGRIHRDNMYEAVVVLEEFCKVRAALIWTLLWLLLVLLFSATSKMKHFKAKFELCHDLCRISYPFLAHFVLHPCDCLWTFFNIHPPWSPRYVEVSS